MNGVHERIRTSDPRIHTTSAFAAVRRRSWSGLSLHRGLMPLGAARPVSTHFPELLQGLARDWHAGSPAKRSPTLSGLIAKVSHMQSPIEESCALSC